MIDILQNPIDKLKTVHMRLKTLKKIDVYIKSIAVAVGSKLNNIIRNGSVIMKNVNVNVYYIPLYHIFKYLILLLLT